MGFRLEKYIDGSANLIVDLNGLEDNATYYLGDTISGAIEYFHLKIDEDTKILRTPTDAEMALINLELSSYEASDFRDKLNEMLKMLNDDEIEQVKILCPKWSGNFISYSADDRVRFNNIIYKVLKTHTSNSNLRPDISSDLFTPVIKNAEGSITEWSASIIYSKGDLVYYNNDMYESIIDDNNIEPSIDDSWKLIEEAKEEEEYHPYDNTLIYIYDDIVAYDGGFYKCIVDTTNKSPSEAPEDWELI